MAEKLGDEEVVVSALQSIGIARARAGELDAGIALLERAAEIALTGNNPDAARALNNLATLVLDRSLPRANDIWLEGKAVAERLGNATVGRYIDGVLVWVAHDGGRWDEALSAADAFIEQCRAGSPHYLESGCHATRAWILLARDDAEGALSATARALELARPAEDPQALLPALSTAVRVHAELGRDADARSAADEMLSFYRRGIAMSTIRLSLYSGQLGRRDELRAALTSLPVSLYADVARMIVDGDFVRAADILAEVGDVSGEADVRLHAAGALVEAGRRADADVELHRALAFFRSVGASRYVRQGEALLAATA
jgi:tetratricopeptide (TPR) repeat protein